MADAKTDAIARRFTANLRKARERAGIPQEELAKRAHLHRTEVSMLERGERTPRIDTVLRVAGALGIQPDELFAGMAWTPPVQTPEPDGEYEIDDGH